MFTHLNVALTYLRNRIIEYFKKKEKPTLSLKREDKLLRINLMIIYSVKK